MLLLNYTNEFITLSIYRYGFIHEDYEEEEVVETISKLSKLKIVL